MSTVTVSCSRQNSFWELFERLKEYKSIEVMNTKQMPIPQDSEDYSHL
jgi:hypothetical protein